MEFSICRIDMFDISETRGFDHFVNGSRQENDFTCPCVFFLFASVLLATLQTLLDFHSRRFVLETQVQLVVKGSPAVAIVARRERAACSSRPPPQFIIGAHHQLHDDRLRPRARPKSKTRNPDFDHAPEKKTGWMERVRAKSENYAQRTVLL